MFTAILNLIADFFRAVFTPGRPSPVTQQTQRKNFTAEVVRADDLLVFRLDFYNLRLKPIAGGKQLIEDVSGDSFIVIHLPPQHLAEQAFEEDNLNDPLLPPPIAARLAGESRLVFHLNPALLPLEFSLETILAALSQCAPLVCDRITAPRPTPPVGGNAEFGGARSQFTSIEAPWRLVLSPHPDGRWAHAPQSVTHGTKTELWHTRLGVLRRSGSQVDETSATRRTARVVFSPDHRGSFGPAPESDLSPFRNSLLRGDRHQIVRLTADRELEGNAPVAVERLMLTSLGAALKLHGEWDTDEMDLVEWRHLATLGRDQFVRVVKKGFMFPLGHRAVKITITERKLAMATGGRHLEGKPVAYLRQRTFIVIREPIKRFTHRHFPFRWVEFKRLKTPNLAPPAATRIPLVSEAGSNTFWPRLMVGGTDVQFLLEGTDWDGRTTRFTAPLIFVPFTADNGADIAKLVDAYNNQAGLMSSTTPPEPIPPVPETLPPPETPRRTIEIGGQKVAFAPSMKPGDTTLETDQLILAALKANGTPHFLPAMRGARINNTALRQISKVAGPALIRYDDGYLNAPASDFGNAGEVFARIDGPTGVKFPIEKTGGLVAPDFTPQGFSRSFGPVGDVASLASGQFKPASIFAGIKILGAIELDKIFKLIPFPWPSQAGQTVPGLTTVRVGDVIQTRYIWKASYNQIQAQPLFQPQPGARFELESVIDAPLDGTAPRFHVAGTLEKFNLVLPPGANALVGANFDHVKFQAATNQKVDVSVKFNDIVFLGDLEFVNEIRKYIPFDGFVDPPYIDVNANGVNAGFTLGLPTIGLGIFSLQNISLSAGFFLPFVGGEAALRFAFCEKDHPFLLTVAIFGGGGFFALVLNTAKVISVEASLEFGAAIALNLGVAAGKASITAGVYYQKSGSDFRVTAFFRAAGSLTVLGIISVSVELYIGLTYQAKGTQPRGKLYGTASIKVKIKIVFFSISVGISIEREFGGSDPTFSQMLTAGHWGEYCGAFAPEP